MRANIALWPMFFAVSLGVHAGALVAISGAPPRNPAPDISQIMLQDSDILPAAKIALPADEAAIRPLAIDAGATERSEPKAAPGARTSEADSAAPEIKTGSEETESAV